MLVKPALLYADKVTIYSPAAWMLKSVDEFAQLSDPRAQVSAMLDLLRNAPALAPDLKIDEGTLRQLLTLLTLDRSKVRTAGRALGGAGEIDDFYRQLDGLQQMWQEQMPEALAGATEAIGGSELLPAIRSGVVHVADMTSATSSAVIGHAVSAALGDSSAGDSDALVEAFMSLAIETVLDDYAFPLLDAQASGLMRAVADIVELRPSERSTRRATEISAAAAFMAYLPYFPELPMDEVLDLRNRLEGPLGRFRGEMALLSAEFSHRPIDDDFVVEVQDAWRSTVEPALIDIREALAEQGFLRQAASIALGDPRRMLVDAGGVLAAAQGDLISLSKFATIGAALGAPLALIVRRAA